MDTELRKKTERTWLPEAKVSDEGLAAIVKSSPLGIIAVNAAGIIRFWNRATEQIFGWREDEVVDACLAFFGKGFMLPDEKAMETYWLESFLGN